jgi:hypothetical protein
MFLDEARIASMIQHENVVQVLDVGLHERCPSSSWSRFAAEASIEC